MSLVQIVKNLLLIGALCVCMMSACTKQPNPSNHNNPNNSSQKDRSKEAAALNTQMGLRYLNQGDRIRAKRKLLYAYQLAPNSAPVNSALGYFMEQSGDKDKAKHYYQQAMKYSQNSGAQLNNYGAFLCREGLYTEADSYFLKAVKDEQYLNSAGAYENAGICASAIPNYALAKTYFKKALEQDPDRRQSLSELIAIAKKEQNSKEILDYIEHHVTLVYNDPALLREALELAKKEHKTPLADFYQKRLLALNQVAAKQVWSKE